MRQLNSRNREELQERVNQLTSLRAKVNTLLIEFQHLKAKISALQHEDWQFKDRKLRDAINGSKYVYHRLVDFHFDVCLECERQQVDLDLCLHDLDATRAAADQ